jgi:hypothetical protein
MTAAHVRDVVDILAQTHDFVILDTPGTFNEIVAAAIEIGACAMRARAQRLQRARKASSSPR